MTRHIRLILIALMLAVAAIIVGGRSLHAQDAPTPPAPPTADRAKAPDAPVPTVPDDAKRAIAELQVKAAGLAQAMAVLQKELDATTADFSRLVQKLQLPDYDLRPDLTYAKKAPPKKDEATVTK